MDVLKSQNADSERRQRSYTGVGSLAASVRVVRSTAAFSQQRLPSETRLNGLGFEAGMGCVDLATRSRKLRRNWSGAQRRAGRLQVPYRQSEPFFESASCFWVTTQCEQRTCFANLMKQCRNL